jgi:hypothetical protein
MRVIALEEHVQFPFAKERIAEVRRKSQGVPTGGPGHEPLLADVGERSHRWFIWRHHDAHGDSMPATHRS